jgi:cupin fold WbuC family metalloprotein
MNTEKLPKLPPEEVSQHFIEAEQSPRKRFPKILHNQGDYHNKVINFVLADSYMQPHLHPGEEKIEKMYLLDGSFALITFDDEGEITNTLVLAKGKRESIDVPAFTWHTYVMLTKEVIIYETMKGVYNPTTWKKMASWAPLENTKDSLSYLNDLKKSATTKKLYLQN